MRTQYDLQDVHCGTYILLADRNRRVTLWFWHLSLGSDCGNDDCSSEEHDDEGREVDQERLGAVLVEAGALQEGELLQEPELRRRQRQDVDEEPEQHVPRQSPAPHARRRPRVEERHEPEYPLNPVQRNGSDPEPGVQAVEVGDPALVVELEGAVDPDGAENDGDRVEDQVGQLRRVVVYFRKYLVDHYRFTAKDDVTDQHKNWVNVEDEVLVDRVEGEPAAEVDAPDEHHDRRRRAQRVRRVRERRRLHAHQPTGHLVKPSSSWSLVRADT